MRWLSCTCQPTKLIARRKEPLNHIKTFRRFASDIRSLSYEVTEAQALHSLKKHHKSPITLSPSTSEPLRKRYVPFYLYEVKTKAFVGASIGRQMAVPYRDPQTGRISQRFKTIWSVLPRFELENAYSSADTACQIYAGFENFSSQLSPFLPIRPAELQAHRSGSGAEEEPFAMHEAFAQKKLQANIAKEQEYLVKEMLNREYGALVRITQLQMEVSVSHTQRAYFPLYVQSYSLGGRTLRTLVSGRDGKTSGLKLYDPMLSGLAGATLVSLATGLLVGPIVGLILGGLGYFAARTVATLLPIWRLARMMAAQAADVQANNTFGGGGGGGQSSGRSGFTGFGGFNPFEQFMGGQGQQQQQGNGNPFDPFSRGGFNGQRTSQDPFYGYGQEGRRAGGGTYGNQSQQRSRPSPRGDDPAGLYAALGLKKTATQDEISTRFRELAMKKHPDKVPEAEKAKASKEFAKINEAYRVLRNAGKRDQYDRFGIS
ncbi:hypothetical protein BCR37DRAFT_377151 [Protomyces lactucae-debilis]|uniref:J domain-containing protein n=1 Tax=Protomyces lactucae-debilis TaxID=2754530 RepID=A0A1Y2FNE8_PROLT|nr:uncharacterized protein BCR37DRAFT_377151 [Protomyces lactucae-debilis]ORY85478.1 hypothetical protein BCR37DRAFT_377151 [Protomyces lactucae-debilis]